MKNRFLMTVSVAAISFVAACSEPSNETQNVSAAYEDLLANVEVSAENAAIFESNPLLAEWTGPYQGVPAFDKMELDDLKPALEAAMAKNLAEVEAIANNPEPATFANTIVAMEDTGRELGNLFTYWGIWSANVNSPEFRTIQGEMAPILSQFFSQITQNENLFARITTIYEGDEMANLTETQQRLVWLNYDGFARNGATLEGEAKERYAAINQALSTLHTDFANNVLADEEGYVTYISADQLSGLPDSFVQAAGAAAESRDHPGEYAITNSRSSMDPFLTYSTERDLREDVWRTYYSRGNNGDDMDNNEIIKQILTLRDERVGLLGYDNYAQWRLGNRMAKNPENALELMEKVWPAAIGRVAEEVADMQAVADAEGADIKIAPWDYRFYAEKVRKDKYDLNSDEVKQYLQLDKLRDGMFMVAGELFNFKFTPLEEGAVPIFHEDVTVYEVTDLTTGDHIGVWYFDPFARPGKRSGAWATTYRSYENFNGKRNVLGSNNSNFVKPAPGEAVLVSWNDAETMFHEFGHALHFFSSNVDYPTFNGGVRDYTEFQSQVLEYWLSTDKVINGYLTHHETGEPIPAELVQKIKDAANFNQGFSTTEYLASALMDMIYHTTDPAEITDVQAFEAAKLAELGMPSELPMRHRSTQFGHIFSGEGYSAGYYGYMWADVLTADTAEAFTDAGGFYDKDVAARMVKHLFSVRNAIDPAEAYRAFRGRDAEMEALMRDRGFPIPEGTTED